MFAHLFAYVPGVWELVIVGGVVLILFGKRLPSTMNALGRSLVEFKKGVKGIEDEPRQDERKDEKAASSQS